MGDFDHDNYRLWAACKWKHAHSVSPGLLGCPFKQCASRLYPKGAAGSGPSKPYHDDNNGVICLSCWTSVTESDQPTNLVFLVNGFEVTLLASALYGLLLIFSSKSDSQADPLEA